MQEFKIMFKNGAADLPVGQSEKVRTGRPHNRQGVKRMNTNRISYCDQDAIEKMGLKPCPFCGSKVQNVEITRVNHYFETSIEMVMGCWCGAEVHIWATDKEQNVVDKAIELWNSRAEEGEADE